MSQPQVDVGIVTWNTRDLSVEALRRLVDSDQGADLRVMVRDNGSDDGTAETIRDQIPEADLDADADNLGFAAGMNRLLARSRAPWFLALNSDAWPEEGAVGALVATAERHPRAAAVAPRIERPDGSLEHSTHPFPSLRVAGSLALAPRSLLRGRRGKEWLLEGAWHHDEERPVDWAVGAALLMRRRAVEDLGGFDETFFMYAEDLEWCWRAHKGGWEIWFTPTATVVHVGNASGERAYGDRRTNAYLHNTDRLLRRERGPLFAALYRGLEAMGAGRNVRRAVRSGDSDSVAHWRAVRRAQREARFGDDRPDAD